MSFQNCLNLLVLELYYLFYSTIFPKKCYLGVLIRICQFPQNDHQAQQSDKSQKMDICKSLTFEKMAVQHYVSHCTYQRNKSWVNVNLFQNQIGLRQISNISFSWSTIVFTLTCNLHLCWLQNNEMLLNEYIIIQFSKISTTRSKNINHSIIITYYQFISSFHLKSRFIFNAKLFMILHP